MAIDINGIRCPNCGSTSVKMLTETRGICLSCQSVFQISPQQREQVINNEIHIHGADSGNVNTMFGSTAQKIAPEITKAMFVRRAWEQIAKEDPPKEAFNSDFGNVSTIEHEILIDRVTAEVRYQASIGYDHQEAYTVFEDKKESYQAYENGHLTTKYRTVKEPVTKYKTVTDWSPFNSVLQCSSIAIEENTPGVVLDKQRFAKCYDSKNNAFVSGFGDSTAHTPSGQTIAQCNKLHNEEFAKQVKRKLPGDRYKDLQVSVVRTTTRNMNMVVCPEYSSVIAVNGRNYTKKAFPFGSAAVGGDVIANTAGIRAFTNQSSSEAQSVVSDHVKYIWIGPLVLFVLGLIFAAFSGGLAGVCIIGSIVLLIVQLVRHSNLKKEENRKSEERVANYSSSYNQSMQELLNKKLQGLGAYSASYAEDVKPSTSQTQYGTGQTYAAPSYTAPPIPAPQTTQTASPSQSTQNVPPVQTAQSTQNIPYVQPVVVPKAEEPVKMEQCSMCGGQMRSNTRFCPVCGAKNNPASQPVQSTPKVEEPVKIKYCVICGSQVRSTARFCNVCGAKRNGW